MLSEALLKVPQSERGGEIAIRGFDYQSCWALSHMLEYELAGKEYVFIFEFHDDILILNSESCPSEATFAQVKTREKHWTWASLGNSNKASPKSILAKLFEHQKNFKEYKTQLMFVTNAYFQFDKDKKSYFLASDLDEDQQSLIINKVFEQTGIPKDSVELSSLKFVKSSLSLEDHFNHLKGRICDFFEEKFGDECILSPSVFAKLLENECRQKAKFKSTAISSFDELVSNKGFSSSILN